MWFHFFLAKQITVRLYILNPLINDRQRHDLYEVSLNPAPRENSLSSGNTSVTASINNAQQCQDSSLALQCLQPAEQ